MGGGVRACDLCDPYAVVLLVDGSVVLVQLVEGTEEDEEKEGEGGETAKLQLTWPDIKVDRYLICTCMCNTLYRVEHYKAF